jgi:hypothetical protein
MNSHPRVTCANSSFFSQVDQFRIARDTTTIRKQPSGRLLNPADYSGLSSDAADEKQIRHPSLRKPPPPGSFQSHSVLVYRLAAELQTLVPLWISPESKEARGRQLRTGQTERGHFSQMPKLGRLVDATSRQWCWAWRSGRRRGNGTVFARRRGMSQRLGALAPLLLDHRAAGKAKKRARHAHRLSVAKRHKLRKTQGTLV